MDEVDVDEFLKEGVEAMEDPEKLSQFIREKSTIAIERFLNYLPKMSIPVEKRELGEGWMLTCHGKDGGDLTLSDVKIRRKNLICQVIGGDSLFFPMFGDDDVDDASVSVPDDINPLFSPSGCIEESILDHIRGILLEAQRQGCWQAGFGGVEKVRRRAVGNNPAPLTANLIIYHDFLVISRLRIVTLLRFFTIYPSLLS
jgi:hypothetical protein